MKNKPHQHISHKEGLKYGLRVEEEWETIRTIIRNRASISRFGDGEFKVMIGGDAVGQDSTPELAEIMKLILTEDVGNLLVGLPRFEGRYDLFWTNEKSALMHNDFMNRRNIRKLINHDKQYYSTLMTRPDSALHLDCRAYWDLCGKMWEGRDVVVCHGGGKPRMGLYTESRIFRGTKSVHYIKAQPRNAYFEYDRIMEEVCKCPKDSLIYLALGVASTVLASDLHKLGYQALDMGHFGMFYGRAHSKHEGWRCVKSCVKGINFGGRWLDNDTNK